MSLIIISRLAVTYLTDNKHIKNPDEYIAGTNKGMDLEGTVKTSIAILQKRKLQNMELHGIGTSAAFSGIIAMAFPTSPVNIRFSDAHRLIYILVIIFTLLLYVDIVWINAFDVRAQLLTFAFFLTIPGSKGLEHGNLDIVFSAVFGVLIIYYLGHNKSSKYSYLFDNLSALILSIIITTKLILIPLIIPFCLRIKNLKVFIIAISIFSSIISLVPMACCQMPFIKNGSLFTNLNALSKYANDIGILSKTTPDHSLLHLFKTALYTIFGFSNIYSTLIIPLVFFGISLIFIYYSVFKSFKIWRYINTVNNNRSNATVFLHFATMAIVAINLLGPRSFDYRTYYSIPILIIFNGLLHNKYQRFIWTMTTGSLLIYGIWFWISLGSLFNMNFSKYLTVLLTAHYYLLIYLSLTIFPKKIKRYLTEPRR